MSQILSNLPDRATFNRSTAPLTNSERRGMFDHATGGMKRVFVVDDTASAFEPLIG